ncbi:hypothetical protein EVAR_64530_1 [Eumeta japonica]|uniref:Uncharacterized protein n=1 Tax=Eumeta variegata TaxID=151549 RepID=A0A4C1ZHY7_EUMVA|nr:hypothetical protein EVAR_64530_1 [Eumeta japonica]
MFFLNEQRNFQAGYHLRVLTNCSEEALDDTLSPCPPSKYRSASGECNNVRRRPWGRRGDVLLRLAPANYADGIYF